MTTTRNPNLGPSHIRQRRRRLFFVRLVIVLFIILVLILFSAIFSGHEKVIIKNIIISGNVSVSNDEILEIVNRDIAGRYWYLFSRNNFIVFPCFKIKADLLTEIKTLESLDISWTAWQEITILVDERKPHSVWCGDDKTKVDEVCFLVDGNGYIYYQAPVFSGDIYIKNYGPVGPEPLGKYFLPTTTYTQIYNLLQLLNEQGLKVLSFSLSEQNYEIGLKLGPKIIFNMKSDLNKTFANLFTAIETKNLDLVAEAENISYIDLRFENKIVIGRKEK